MLKQKFHLIQSIMDTSEIKKGYGFWREHRETIITISIILLIMLSLKYLFQLALHSHLV